MAIDLSDLLERGVILTEPECASRKRAILRLSGALAEKLEIDERRIFDAVMEREQLGSTGVGEGVAIPHARIPKLEAPLGGFLKLLHCALRTRLRQSFSYSAKTPRRHGRPLRRSSSV